MIQKNAQGFNLDVFELLVDPIGRLTAPSRMTIRGGLLRLYEARNDVIIPNHQPLTTSYCLPSTSYLRKFMYGSLLASSCTLSALAMRAERACQEPSRN